MAFLEFDPQSYPYASRRTLVYGRRGMVATAQPLAAQAGLEILQSGGNAVDAAVAAAACLPIVEPTSNGLGGDAFALVFSQGKLHGMNASGPAPQRMTRDLVRSEGWREMPLYGWYPVTVPGIPAAWAALVQRFGRLDLPKVLAPAIRLAREGFPVSSTVAYFWQRAYRKFSAELHGQQFAEWFRVFAPQGRAPLPGEMWKFPDHAGTLEDIAASGAQSYYRGALAQKIVQFSHQTGGVMSAEDLAAFQVEWVRPLSVPFQGFDVWELPPNGQGVVALMALKMLDGLHPADEAERIHLQIEALKLAFADARRYVADTRFMPVSAEDLLDEAYLARRRALIGPEAQMPQAGQPPFGGTVYLATADDQGNMVSYIQSNYEGFGSGLVVPSTGIALHNRGQLFSLEAGHPNMLAPGKKPYHTIIPGFLTDHGQPIGPFGVMGGFMQPQGHVQVLSRILAQKLNPQAALDAPRFYWQQGKTVVVEKSMPANVVEALRRRGHDVRITSDPAPFGRGEIVWKMPGGALMGATEPRADGTVACW
ncbi:MAG: gamma-glutamyltransferase family protein [Firmicutes bacterium]|nr:gamma-glutamyltransferase family protein [Bacillota bacterium]